jgi:hypothetical protein
MTNTASSPKPTKTRKRRRKEVGEAVDVKERCERERTEEKN